MELTIKMLVFLRVNKLVVLPWAPEAFHTRFSGFGQPIPRDASPLTREKTSGGKGKLHVVRVFILPFRVTYI